MSKKAAAKGAKQPNHDRTETVRLLSLGGAGTVTGSKHLLLTPSLNVLIDCGLFQGLKSLREQNRLPLPVHPATIDVVILTHAHLDHCGYLPLLVKNGFTGSIFMTEPTRYLAELILRDSAKLQEEDADNANRHGFSRHRPALPLYTNDDVTRSLSHMKPVPAATQVRLNDHNAFTLYPSGHIPGAASVVVRSYGKDVLFSGDIGRYRSLLLPPPVVPPRADFVIMESTYGDRLHEKDDAGAALAFVVNDTLASRGNIIIPSFAVGRAQEIMLLLFNLKRRKKIPAEVPVYLDSPMASAAGKVLLRNPAWTLLRPKECLQLYESVIVNEEHRGTEKIIRRRGSKIVLAGSGMITGGRVLEYLESWLGSRNNTIVLAGFQAEGTRGRALLNGAAELKIRGRYYPVKARVAVLGNLSAHADQSELLRWLAEIPGRSGPVFLVHGEADALEALRVKMRDVLNVEPTIVQPGEEQVLFTVSTNVHDRPLINEDHESRSL